jgi:transposase InsO family protein
VRLGEIAVHADGADGHRAQAAFGTTSVLSEEIRLLERHSVDFRRRHVEASCPGDLLNQDTFFWGTLKGVGKVYVQVLVDVFCSLAFAKVYISKMPPTACDLYDRVFPFYAALGVPIGAILTDNGRSSVDAPMAVPSSYCWPWGIEHRTMRVRSPRTNGFVERMNRTLLAECFRVKGRTEWYTSPDHLEQTVRRTPKTAT